MKNVEDLQTLIFALNKVALNEKFFEVLNKKGIAESEIEIGNFNAKIIIKEK